MIEIACPRCGAGGRVPRDRVNARLVCKKCLQVFHLGPTLTAIKGEPPPEETRGKKKTKTKSAPREKTERERPQLSLPGLERLTESLSNIKLPDGQTVGIVAGIILVVAFFWWLFSKPSVETRSYALAHAIGTAELQNAVEMALSGTEMEAIKWTGDLYRDYLQLKLDIGNLEPGVDVSVQTNGDGTAQSLIVFSSKGATSSGPLSVEEASKLASKDKKQSLELVVFWARDGLGTWRFDGKRTLETAEQQER